LKTVAQPVKWFVTKSITEMLKMGDNIQCYVITVKEMYNQTTQLYRWMFNAHCQVKYASLEKLCIVQFQSDEGYSRKGHRTREKIIPCLPGVWREGEGLTKWTAEDFVRWWNYSYEAKIVNIWHCFICQTHWSTQHKEQPVMSAQLKKSI
jgi:hypothetical protein